MMARHAAVVAVAISISGCVGQPKPGVVIGSPARTEPATGQSTVVPRPTVAPTVAPVTSPGPWLAAPDQDSVRRVQFRDVAWTGERFVATASVIEAGGGFLDSSDGRMWTLRSETSPIELPVSLGAGPGGVVAVGSIDGTPASWFSHDGLVWTARTNAFPVDPAAAETDAIEVTDVVATDAGWLAVGREDPPCNVNCGLAPVRSIVWMSDDGLDWTRAADQMSLNGAAMTAVTRRASGFVAVGLADLRAIAWTSADGFTWTRAADSPELDALPSDDPPLWTTMDSVATRHGLVVAVGYEGPAGGHGPAARAWWSADGRTWANADGADFLSGGETSVMLAGVTATADGFVAVGSSSGGCPGGIWDSPDGHAWGCSAGADRPLAGLVPSAVAASDSVSVVVGLANVSDPPLDGLPGAVWSRRLP